jgi:hypothetical protein
MAHQLQETVPGMNLKEEKQTRNENKNNYPINSM